MATARPQLVTSFADWPLIWTIEDIARFYRVSTKTVRRRMYAGTFQPPPFKKYPYLWRRVDVEREYNAPTRKAPSRKPQGFAAARGGSSHHADANATK